MYKNSNGRDNNSGRDGDKSRKRILKAFDGNSKYSNRNEGGSYPKKDYRKSGDTDRRGGFGGDRRGGFNDRKSSYSDRKSYGDRDNRGGYSERKSYGDRDNRGGYSERKSYGDRGNRGGYSERKSYGDRGNRGNYSERKSYGDRDNRGGYSERKSYGVDRERRPSTNGNYTETKFNDKNDNIIFRKRKSSEDYDPNDKYSRKKQIEFRKNFFDPSKPIRLNKYLSNAGICSRREADDYIKAGLIMVNGEIVTELGTKVMITDVVRFHDEPVRLERKIYILLNKPKDFVTTVEDTHNRRTVMDIVANACSERIYPVGRLDRNTTGVLLLTNDGELTTKLTHPKYDKKKIYHVGLDKDLTQEHYDNIMSGVDLGDFTVKADALEFVKAGLENEVGLEIHSGQNRVVRRIFEHLGYKVIKLDRVYFAGLTKKGIPRGKYRFLSEKEVNILKMGSYE